jgi:hypothetical protein
VVNLNEKPQFGNVELLNTCFTFTNFDSIISICTELETVSMADIIYPEIKDKYNYYTKLLKDRKSVFDSVIEIRSFGNNNKILEKETGVKHESIQDEIILIVNVRISNQGFFQFKLRCKSLAAVPFFRYDSDGDTHRNYGENIPLSQQQITTPHFHRFTEDGRNFAYKTDRLLDEKECKSLEDINACIAHFFDESNTRLGENNYPSCTVNPQELQLDISMNDPLDNIVFK